LTIDPSRIDGANAVDVYVDRKRMRNRGRGKGKKLSSGLRIFGLDGFGLHPRTRGEGRGKVVAIHAVALKISCKIVPGRSVHGIDQQKMGGGGKGRGSFSMLSMVRFAPAPAVINDVKERKRRERKGRRISFVVLSHLRYDGGLRFCRSWNWVGRRKSREKGGGEGKPSVFSEEGKDGTRRERKNGVVEKSRYLLFSGLGKPPMARVKAPRAQKEGSMEGHAIKVPSTGSAPALSSSRQIE